jgi:D-sedoheptulose 7-phosphate isomerase
MIMTSPYIWSANLLVTLDDFSERLESYRAENKVIVTTNGCFDLLHAGHVQFLQEAKALGDVLIVGLNSDASVRRIKGSGRPILPEAERAAMLMALKAVDHVLIFDELLPNDFLAAVKPAIHCKAGDYSRDALPEAEVVRRHGGEIRILPFMAGYSTSKMIDRILASGNNHEPALLAGSSTGDRRSEVMEYFLASSNVLRQAGYRLADEILAAAELMIEALHSGHKVLVCGNGGSAADAQHLAGELVVRYKLDRQALPAISLTHDPSTLTASGNDYGYEQVFSRQVQAYGRPGDVLVAISTSGRSPNILAAIREAKERRLKVLGLTGQKQSPLHGMVDICLAIPSEDTPLVQQAHTAAIHILCDLIERSMKAW